MHDDAFWEFERSGWERAAEFYEECWTDTGLFVEPLLDAVGVRAGLRLLDVACGPGFVSEAAAARGAEPVGLDVAAAMVERARLRCPALTFVQGDAQALPFPDSSFDAATMCFGILHLSQPELALTEACRVLVPGGRFAFTAWVAEGNAVAEIVDQAVAAHAVSVQVPEGPDFYRFAAADECRRALAEAGFDVGSFRAETVAAPWRVPPQSFCSKQSFRPVSAPPRSTARAIRGDSRRDGRRRSALRRRRGVRSADCRAHRLRGSSTPMT